MLEPHKSKSEQQFQELSVGHVNYESLDTVRQAVFPENHTIPARSVAVRVLATPCIEGTDPEAAAAAVDQVFKEFWPWFQQAYDRKPLTNFAQIPAEWLKECRLKLGQSEAFAEALRVLKLSDHADKITLPGWNKVNYVELDNQLVDGVMQITLGLRHSYQTLACRNGLLLPMQSCSVSALIKSNDGYAILGLRGGHNYPNTYHVVAGGLSRDVHLEQGHKVIEQVLLETQLLDESGITEAMISNLSFRGRYVDPFDGSLQFPGVVYHWDISTHLSKAELIRQAGSIHNADSFEHQRFVAIEDSPEGALEFIQNNFKGVVKNDVSRRRDSAVLLPQGLSSLMLSYGIGQDQVAGFCQAGLH
ncbi:MAG: hypothetical protein KDD62_09910 [Bdellovibrionales bacterium]|nr:hypothetical protein [Bdellovibrionales bacterium]